MVVDFGGFDDYALDADFADASASSSSRSRTILAAGRAVVVRAAFQLFCGLGGFRKASADEVHQRALRAAACMEHAAAHEAAAGVCSDLGRFSGTAAASRVDAVHDRPATGAAAGGHPWLK